GTINSVTGGDGISASVTGGTATVSLAPSGVGVADIKGTATMVPRISYDTYGRILNITEQAVIGTLPSAGADHQVLMSNGGA
ncbi:hypothetical protein NL487_28925, partial [Klebsiella pneumoniae]|nr:hypothetical protein [Klebsiella pneumoniae]